MLSSRISISFKYGRLGRLGRLNGCALRNGLALLHRLAVLAGSLEGAQQGALALVEILELLQAPLEASDRAIREVTDLGAVETGNVRGLVAGQEKLVHALCVFPGDGKLSGQRLDDRCSTHFEPLVRLIPDDWVVSPGDSRGPAGFGTEEDEQG